jgi:nucleoid-associated protein YgaU
MTIFTGSRYAGQAVVSVPVNAAGATSRTVYGPKATFPARFTYYMTKLGDRYDLIANQVYGRPDLWWQIADANPEIFFPDDLISGAIIRIPAP